MNNFFPFRHSRDELIQIAPHLIPDPLPDVPVLPENYIDVLSTGNLVVGTVESGEKASIFIDMSQRGVVYQLYTEDHVKMGDPVIGDCEEIELETTPLIQKPDQEWFEFYVLATQPSTGVEIKLETLIWINAGQDDGVDPRPKSLKIRWDAPFEVLIPDSQPNLTWRLRHGNGDDASPSVASPADGGDVNLISTPLRENEKLVIRVKNNENDKEKDLTQIQSVKVFPNPNLIFENVSHPYYAAYAGTIDIAVLLPQSTVSYQLVEKLGEDEYRATGEPVVGTAVRIVLTSGPLYDITTLRVLATKLRDDLADPEVIELETDLFEYLNGEIEIDVEPDPTILVEPERQIIDYNTGADISIPQPQPETTYFLHCGDGVPISDSVLSEGDPITLTSILMQEDCIVMVRAERRFIIKDLYTHPKILVKPNFELPVELFEGYFRRSDGTKILVHNAQASVTYELYKQPAAFTEDFDQAILCDTIADQSGLIELHTGELPADQYRFYILAKKPEREGPLTETIELEVSIRRDITVVSGSMSLDYLGTTFLEIPSRQPYVKYRIVDEEMRPLSEYLLPEEPETRMETFPLAEDTHLYIQADQTLTDVEGLLDFNDLVLVGPNTGIDVLVPQGNVEFGEEAGLHFSDGQKSVTYIVSGHPRTTGGSPPPTFTREYSPPSDGPFSMGFGPVQWPLDLSILAIKTVNRLEAPIPVSLEINPYPNRSQSVVVKTHPENYGATGSVEIEGSDWNTRYQLIDPDESPEGLPVSITSPKSVELTTTPLFEDLRVSVWASGLVTGLNAVLDKNVHLHVPPNLNLVPELVNLPFEIHEGAEIRIDDTQESTKYRLEIKGYDENDEEQESEFTQYTNGGGTITLSTDHLHELRYEIRVNAKKKHSGLSGFFPTLISFFAGVMVRTEVNIDKTVLNYGESTSVTIIDPQPMAQYQLFSRHNEPLSDPVTTGEIPTNIVLPTYELYEDHEIKVKVNNLISDAKGTLREKKSVLLYPNPDLNPVLQIAETVYGGHALLSISNAQESVRYELIRQSVDEPGAPSHLQTGVVIERKSPHRDGEMNYAIGPLHYDQSFSLSAVKISSGLRIDFPETYSVFVGPFRFVDARYDSRYIFWDQIVPVYLRYAQLGVKYQLRDASAPDGEGFVDEIVFNHFNVPVGQAIVGDDLAVFNPGGSFLLMRTPPVERELTYEIIATKARNGLQAVMHERVYIRVRRGRRR